MQFEQVRIPAWRAVVENLRVEPQLAFVGAEADRTAEDLVVLGLRCALTAVQRSEEHTSELQSLMRISYAVFCLKKKTTHINTTRHRQEYYTPINNRTTNASKYDYTKK